MRTIKRYRNRKLYDTKQSRYITLVGLGELLQQGEDIRVIDAKTHKDITGTVLTQVLLKQQRNDGIPVALARLRELLHTSVQRLSTEAEKTVQRPISEVRQFLENTVGTFEEIQSMVDERMDTMLDTIKQLSPVQRDCKVLKDRLADLEKRVAQLEKRLKTLSGGDDER